MSTPLIQPEPPDPNLEEGRRFWRELGRGLVSESIKTVDETARQIITVTGLLEGLYFHAISFSDLRSQLTGLDKLIYIAPLALLLVSLVAAFAVFFPDRYRVNIFSSTGSKETFEAIVRSKLFAMRVAAAFLILGVGGVALAMVAYLG